MLDMTYKPLFSTIDSYSPKNIFFRSILFPCLFMSGHAICVKSPKFTWQFLVIIRMSPVSRATHLSGMNSFCVHMVVFIPPHQDGISATTNKHGALETFARRVFCD